MPLNFPTRTPQTPINRIISYSRGLAVSLGLMGCSPAIEEKGSTAESGTGAIETTSFNDSTGKNDSSTTNKEDMDTSGELPQGTDMGVQTSTPDSPTSTTDATSTTGEFTGSSNADSTTGIPSECGNGLIEGDEFCDNGVNDGITCNLDCSEPRCGDGIQQKENGEGCDDGVNDGSYGSCAVDCTDVGPHCGDNEIQVPQEECDDKKKNADYGCNEDCQFAPERCGDGIVQKDKNEQCDVENIEGFECQDDCLFDLSKIKTMPTEKKCPWGGGDKYDPIDGEMFCKATTGKADAQVEYANLWDETLALPGISCENKDNKGKNVGPRPGVPYDIFYYPDLKAAFKGQIIVDAGCEGI